MCGYNYNRQLGKHFTTNLLLDINGNQIYEKDSRFRNTKFERSEFNDMEEEQIEEQIVPAIRKGSLLNIYFFFQKKWKNYSKVYGQNLLPKKVRVRWPHSKCRIHGISPSYSSRSNGMAFRQDFRANIILRVNKCSTEPFEKRIQL